MDTPVFEERPPPNIAGHQRHPADVPPAGWYQLGEPVWVYRHAGWHRGVVEGRSSRAVLVRYQPAGQRGHLSDTLTADQLAPRTTTHAFTEQDRR